MDIVGQKMARWVGRFRHVPPVRWLGHTAYLFWRAYENRNFDLTSNGEAWCLRRLRQHGVRCVFDVGANIGAWLLVCRQYHPEAEIHAFEIAPPTFTRLQKTAGQLSEVFLNQLGLSDGNGTIDIHYVRDADWRTS